MLAKRFHLTADFDSWLGRFSRRDAILASRFNLTFAMEARAEDQDRLHMPGAVSVDACIAMLERFQSALLNGTGLENVVVILAYEDLRDLLEERTARDVSTPDVLRRVLPRLPARERRLFERALEYDLDWEAMDPIPDGRPSWGNSVAALTNARPAAANFPGASAQQTLSQRTRTTLCSAFGD